MDIHIQGLVVRVDEKKNSYMDGLFKGFRVRVVDIDQDFFQKFGVDTPTTDDFHSWYADSIISPAEAIGNFVLKMTGNHQYIDNHVNPEEDPDLEPYHDEEEDSDLIVISKNPRPISGNPFE